jgi:PBP1b-binding outer membrane lipoprotein LpoB
MMRTLLLAAGMAVLLTGCMSPVVLRDPATGQVAQCNASAGGFFPIIGQHQIDTCVESYERMGWKRI